MTAERITDGMVWEADHRVPVWNGGGQCGLENLQTLCVACHRAKTTGEARTRADQRRVQGALRPGTAAVEAAGAALALTDGSEAAVAGSIAGEDRSEEAEVAAVAASEEAEVAAVAASEEAEVAAVAASEEAEVAAVAASEQAEVAAVATSEEAEVAEAATLEDELPRLLVPEQAEPTLHQSSGSARKRKRSAETAGAGMSDMPCPAKARKPRKSQHFIATAKAAEVPCAFACACMYAVRVAWVIVHACVHACATADGLQVCAEPASQVPRWFARGLAKATCPL
jgi:hypothetical protein